MKTVNQVISLNCNRLINVLCVIAELGKFIIYMYVIYLLIKSCNGNPELIIQNYLGNMTV
jgi:hypothetical protein